MATYNTYDDGSSTITGGFSGVSAPGCGVLTGVFDASLRNLAAADVVEVITVPAGTIVEAVCYEVITADATQTMDIGDGVDPNGWVAVGDVGTVGNTGLGGGALAVAVGAGKYYATADTIDIAVPATKAFDTLKVKVTAVCTVIGIAG